MRVAPHFRQTVKRMRESVNGRRTSIRLVALFFATGLFAPERFRFLAAMAWSGRGDNAYAQYSVKLRRKDIPDEMINKPSNLRINLATLGPDQL
jgi:hypothetical protein